MHLVVQPDCKSGAWRHGRFDPCHTLVTIFTALYDLIERLPEWRVPVDTLFVPVALWLQYSYEKYMG